MTAPRLALKIDVDTLRGTLEGVPRLVEVLKRFEAPATFLFSLGPDHTGRAIKRVFRKGFFGKVKRTSVVEHYGIKTLLYGTLLPGPDIAARAGDTMRAVHEAGFEVGIHCFDHVKWQDHVMRRDAAWSEREMQRAIEAFERVFGFAAQTHGAAGWQMSPDALRLTQRLGFRYASDCRGESPFYPIVRGELIDCAQVPTTLPTLDELIGLDGLNEANVHQRLLALCDENPRDHVFTLHAELEGRNLLPVFDRLLEGWRAQGFQFETTRDTFRRFLTQPPAYAEFTWGEIAGRSGTLAKQGKPFLV